MQGTSRFPRGRLFRRSLQDCQPAKPIADGTSTLREWGLGTKLMPRGFSFALLYKKSKVFPGFIFDSHISERHQLVEEQHVKAWE